MARPKGIRSADYDQRREALLARVAEVLVQAYPQRLSFREIAAACAVSQPTLRHYFTDREGLICAHLDRYSRQGAPYLGRLAETDLPLRASLQEMAQNLLAGFTLPYVGTAQAVALSEALSASALGPEYLARVLEPALQAVAARLVLHMARGELRPCDPRPVAAMLVSPIMLASLHQAHLGGQASHPLDLSGLADEVAEAILRSYAAASGKAQAAP